VEPLPIGLSSIVPGCRGGAGWRSRNTSRARRCGRCQPQAVETFPEFMFIPGFWSEFGMCTEPSALERAASFRATLFPMRRRCSRASNRFWRSRNPILPLTGFCPLSSTGCAGTSRDRGPRPQAPLLHLARSVQYRDLPDGMTEFLIALKTEPETVHRLLRVITDFSRNGTSSSERRSDDRRYLDPRRRRRLHGRSGFHGVLLPLPQGPVCRRGCGQILPQRRALRRIDRHYADIGINVFTLAFRKRSSS